MTTNPALGVLLHAIGGLAAGSFYAPLKKVERWAWESFWLVMGIAAWIVAPWFVAWLTTPRLIDVLSDSPERAMWLVRTVRPAVGRRGPDVRPVRCVTWGSLWA